jgi:hypothetical protein
VSGRVWYLFNELAHQTTMAQRGFGGTRYPDNTVCDTYCRTLGGEVQPLHPEVALPALRIASIIDRIVSFFGGPSQPTVVFRTSGEGHAMRHLIDRGIETVPVRDAIRNDLAVNGASKPIGGGWTGTVNVQGQSIEYSAYRLPDGRINVGIVRPPR